MDRRDFLTSAAALGVSCVATGNASASPREVDLNEVYGVLTDTTECIGCRKCEWACNETNHLPLQSLESLETQEIFKTLRRPDAAHYTVVNRYPGPEGSPKPLWVKVQCMHCNDPACYSACLVTAFTKTEKGPVIYNADRCMGCRYCMVACPFQVPAYEYQNALNPQVRKCTMCSHRTLDGGVPACVEICPPQCLTYGKRVDLLQLAREKIEKNPGVYIDHIYGEHEAGGTSWLFISNKPFTEIGLPALGEQAPPEMTEGLQHGIFKYFLPPAALFTVLGMISTVFKGEEVEEHGNPGKRHAKPGNDPPDPKEQAAPVGKQLLSPGVLGLIVLMAVGFGVALIRFFQGLGAVTHLNDQYPWGLWIAVDVATGVALAAWGFTTAALVHIFHQEKYHPILRPALLTALLGYTFVVLGLLVDLGRYYNVWHPMMPWMWSGHSVLFEVGMCVMIYMTVLYIEFLPIVVERFRGRVALPGSLSGLNRPVEALLQLGERTLPRVMFFFIIAGVVLSCLHQSSLGALMLIVPNKMHSLWYTPILPLLFLMSAIAVGYPMVIFESMVASKVFRQKPEMDLLAPLSRIIPIFLAVYLAFKIGDLAIRNALPLLADGSVQSWMFLLEITMGVIVPMILLFQEWGRRSSIMLFTSAMLIVLGVALNRVNVFITAYQPLYKVTPYFPSVGEFAVTIGLIAALMFIYRLFVTIFPIIPASHEERSEI